MGAESFGALLRRLRVEAGLTQEELAERTKLSAAGISALERGARQHPWPDTVRALAEVLAPVDGDRAALLASVPRRGGPRALPPDPDGWRSVRQLPPDPADFVGRNAELAALLRHVRRTAARPPVLAITGMAGVGKTSLALRLARQLADRFPDGQLWVDLRGSDVDRPLSPEDALAAVLHDTGTPPAEIPADRDRAAGVLRDRLAGRRVLLVLDDAADAGQVVPLLPGDGRSTVVVTGRRMLGALPGVHHLSLDVLPEPDAVRLLAAVAGPDRIDVEGAAAGGVVRLCGRLPLALRLAGARLATRPAWSVAHLLAKLTDERARLDQLSAGEVTVRSSFAASMAAMADSGDGVATARAFGLLSLPAGPGVTVSAAARLLDVDPHRAGAVLTELADLHLLVEHQPDRFRFHDLVRVYGREWAAEVLSPAERADALTRWITDYAQAAWACLARTHPGSVRLELADAKCDLARFDGVADALAWLDAEVALLPAAVAQAAAGPRPELAVQLALGLFGFHVIRSPPGWVRVNRTALAVALDRPDGAPAAAQLRHDLAVALTVGGRHEEAVEELSRSRALFAGLGDDAGEARTLSSLSRVLSRLRRWADAAEVGERSLRLGDRLGDLHTQAVCSLSLGIAYGHLGQADRQLHHFGRCLARYEQLGDRRGAAVAGIHIGAAHARAGRLTRGLELVETSLEVMEELGDDGGTAHALVERGRLLARLDRLPAAADDQERAVLLAVRGGFEEQEAVGRHLLGAALVGLGRQEAGREHWRSALTTFERIGDDAAAAAVRADLAGMEDRSAQPGDRI